MKKFIVLTLSALMILSLAACGSKKGGSKDTADTTTTEEAIMIEGNETAQPYLEAFMNSEATTAKDLAHELAAIDDMMEMDMTPGYLDGFDADITEFTACTKFSPMIGSIPFVGYVFETNDVDALLDQVNNNYNLAWNICTEASDAYCLMKGNMVFFLMCGEVE